MDPKQKALTIAQALFDRKAQDITVLHVAPLTTLADYLVIASGFNHLQVKGLADYVTDMTEEKGFDLRRTEGVSEGAWVVIDYADVIVHIFRQEEREYYNLEKLWDNGKNRLILPFDNLGEEE
ncbi:MAG: ribosome silencing factor [Christensenellales bacterium]|jgi:ribosome-associated protein|nr:ribosome silencing factor [Clostridiales bacterium]